MCHYNESYGMLHGLSNGIIRYGSIGSTEYGLVGQPNPEGEDTDSRSCGAPLPCFKDLG